LIVIDVYLLCAVCDLLCFSIFVTSVIPSYYLRHGALVAQLKS
jgi:hypothetical protein